MASILYDKVYSGLGGADFSGDPSEISPSRLAYLVNMIRDDTPGQCEGLSTVEGFRPFLRREGPIRGLFAAGEHLFVHAGRRLWRVPLSKKDEGAEAAAEAAYLYSRASAQDPAVEDPLLLADAPSAFFSEGDRVFLLDGEHLAYVRGDEFYNAAEMTHVPLLRREDREAEQQNLLFSQGFVSYIISEEEKHRYHTPSLLFRTEEDGRCYVTGMNGSETLLSIPASVTIGGRGYTVVGIEDDAFRDNRTVETLIIAEGVSHIGYRAFMKMQALTTCVLPSTVKRLPEQAFYHCHHLSTVYCRKGLLSVGYACMSENPITHVHFSGTTTDYMEIEGRDNLCPMDKAGATFHYESYYRVSHLAFPLGACTQSLVHFTIDNSPIEVIQGVSYHVYGAAGALSLYLRIENQPWAFGKTMKLRVKTVESRAFAASYPDYRGSGKDAVVGCRLVTRFRGRLFYSGNPALPGLVFYTGYRENGEHDPLYVGAYSFFRDGNGAEEVVSMSASGDSLFVFVKNKNTGEGGIYCHKESTTTDSLLPAHYPVKYSLPLEGCYASCCYYDEVLLLSSGGLDCLSRESLSAERALSHRSSLVDARLLREELSGAVLTRFRGYLALAVNGKLFLMDGRAPASVAERTEYEWYYLEGIGEYLGQHDAFFYRSSLPAALEGKSVQVGETSYPLSVKEEEGPVPEGREVMSVTLPVEGGERTVFFLLEEGRAFLLDSAGEKTGGTFTPATCFTSREGLLFFGTEGGGVFLFSTDKRDESGRIPPEYYAFNGRRYLSACATKSDACGAPHLLKQTERKSAVLKASLLPGARLRIRVRTDREDWAEKDCLRGGRRGYGETDFSADGFLTGDALHYPFRDRTGPWCEKQYYLYSDEFCRPFSLSSLAYRYRIKGPLRG